MSSASVSSGVCVVRPSSVVYVILVFRPYVSWKTSSHVEMVHLWIISSLKHVVCWFRRGDDPPSINERRRRHVLRGVFAFMTHFVPLFDVCLFFIHPPCLFSQPLCVFVPYWPCCVIYGSMAWRLMLMLWLRCWCVLIPMELLKREILSKWGTLHRNKATRKAKSTWSVIHGLPISRASHRSAMLWLVLYHKFSMAPFMLS